MVFPRRRRRQIAMHFWRGFRTWPCRQTGTSFVSSGFGREHFRSRRGWIENGSQMASATRDPGALVGGFTFRIDDRETRECKAAVFQKNYVV